MNDSRIDIRSKAVENYFGHNHFKIDALPVDCSFRSYYRVRVKDKTFILMDSPPDQEDPRPFIKVTDILRKYEMSAPEIFYSDVKNGILIIEDFGEYLLKSVLIQKSYDRRKLYQLAIDALIHLQSNYQLTNEVDNYDDKPLIKEANVFTEWYLPMIARNISSALKNEYEEIFFRLFKKLNYKSSTITLRDYHVENLFFLKERVGIKSIGLIDYQDALNGSYAYDLVSLLEDARIEVDQKFREEMINYYLESAHFVDRIKFLEDYIVLGVQRDLKIIGIFARKKMRDGNDGYVKYIPRMWKYIKDNINSPILTPLKKWFDKAQISIEELCND
ncbi:MAG: phosphotransferase [Rickettsiales bacterium]